MAKCGITNIGGGGGIGSDELTATKDYVLNGLEYVGADTDDEKGVGVMINNGTTANQNLNAGGSFLVKGGYHAQPFTVNANSLESQTPGNTTSDKVLNGFKYWSNGVQGTGTMPNYGGVPSQINNIRINNNRFEVAVAKGYHGEYWAGNSYEYMSYDQIANAIGLTPAKLKKGETVCGRTGTFEGYVPTPADLYLRGNNISNAGIIYDYNDKNVYMESGGIRSASSTSREILGDAVSLNFPTSINYTPYNYFNIQVLYQSYSWTSVTVRNVYMFACLGQTGTTSSNVFASTTRSLSSNLEMTISIPVSTLSFTRSTFMRVGLSGERYWPSSDEEPAGWYPFSYASWNGWVYRIWLS